jgi:site-specific recombinase XerD
MALEDVFGSSCDVASDRMLPLGVEIESYFNWLDAQGFSAHSRQCKVSHVSRFNSYLRRLGRRDCRDVERRHAESFLSHGHWRRRGGSRRMFKDASRAVWSFLKYLSVRGIIEASPPSPPPYAMLLEGFLDYLRCVRALRESSIKAYRYYVTGLLECLEIDAITESLHKLTTAQIQALFAQQAKGKAVSTRGVIRAAWQSFLGFCAKRGYTASDLSRVLPKIFSYALSRVPRGVSEGDVVRVLECIDRTRRAGLRDYAIIRLLWIYGIRGSQILGLRIQDIDWRHSRIRFRAVKGGKEIIQPLTNEVGESLLAYLRHGRPQAAYSEVFLTACAPLHPLRHLGNVYNIVAQYMRRAGVAGPCLGPQSFRHAFATRMLGRGQSLKVIADMLGHRRISSSLIYTKVDVQMLGRLPLEWPEVQA